MRPLIPILALLSPALAATVDLGDLTGLTPGHDIIITFTTGNSLVWVGGFTADEGDLTFNYQARLSITVGAFDAQSNESWSYGPLPWIGGASGGYEFGPFPASFALTVPWGTNLAAVSLTLTDLSSITGRPAASHRVVAGFTHSHRSLQHHRDCGCL